MSAQDRAHRIGQKNEVRVFRLTTNAPIEERILARANDKKNMTGLVVEAGTFNASSHDNNEGGNKAMMESLLNEWISNGAQATGENKGDLEEDSDIPDDDQLNDMMATCEGELELYRAFDHAWKNDKTRQAGLMSQSERPHWLCKDRCLPRLAWLFFPEDGNGKQAATTSDAMIEEMGPRKRKEVCYNDNLTDIQFMKRIEKDQDAEETSKKQAKRPRSDIEATLAKCLDELIKNSSSKLFRDKPSKQQYPDYYIEIKSPISLKDILRKINNNGYTFFEEIELDFALMSHNARLYNGPGEVFDQAEYIRRLFYDSIQLKLQFVFLTCPTLPEGSYMVRNQLGFKLKLTELSVVSTNKRPKHGADC